MRRLTWLGNIWVFQSASTRRKVYGQHSHWIVQDAVHVVLKVADVVRVPIEDFTSHEDSGRVAKA